MPVGKRELFHDPELDFYVLAHVQEGGKTGRPHSHGTSWAIYGNAKNVTNMTEYRRANPESEEHVVLEPVAKYGLRPGDTRGYGPGVIHSTQHPEKAWVIRVTGCDLDKLPRYPSPQAGPGAGEGLNRGYRTSPSPHRARCSAR